MRLIFFNKSMSCTLEKRIVYFHFVDETDFIVDTVSIAGDEDTSINGLIIRAVENNNSETLQKRINLLSSSFKVYLVQPGNIFNSQSEPINQNILLKDCYFLEFFVKFSEINLKTKDKKSSIFKSNESNHRKIKSFNSSGNSINGIDVCCCFLSCFCQILSFIK